MDPVRLAERGLLPDSMIRFGIRRRLGSIRKELYSGDSPLPGKKQAFIEKLNTGPVALKQSRVNAQHYELPPEFFRTFLGPRRKYSCCFWQGKKSTLEEAEETMLKLTAERADIKENQRILELGCGWGSFSLWAAETYPSCRFHALSNSAPQVALIRREADALGLTNLTVETADVTAFDTENRYDRVVSVEMFEHIRNWGNLIGNISQWLKPEGKCFLHFFCHREIPYLYTDENPLNWMGYYFFAGGMMPCFDLPRHFSKDLSVEASWKVNGLHYVRTLEAWLYRMDRHKADIENILKATYGQEWSEWGNRWRIFLMACSELFGTNQGEEWFVAHYLLRK